MDPANFAAVLSQPAEVAAPRLLGCLLRRRLGEREVVCRIVETEAYDQADPASHSYRGISPRTQVMFGPAGFLYVYFIYGAHYCCNVVTGEAGHGSAVLIRAVEPVSGSELLVPQRPLVRGPAMTNGPAKLCQALIIDRTLNGHDLREPPLELALQPALPPEDIVQTTRIGLSRAQDVPWRFYLRGNAYVSRL